MPPSSVLSHDQPRLVLRPFVFIASRSPTLIIASGLGTRLVSTYQDELMDLSSDGEGGHLGLAALA